MAEYIFGRSNHTFLGPYVILLADDVRDVANAAYRLRDELADPKAKTVAEFKRVWEPLFRVNDGASSGHFESGGSREEFEELELNEDRIVDLMVSADSPTTVRTEDGIGGRYKTYSTYFCMRAVGPGSDVHPIIAPFLTLGRNRAAVEDIKSAVAVLRNAGHVCANDEEALQSVFDRITSLDYLASCLTGRSVVTNETLLHLPDSIVEHGFRGPLSDPGRPPIN